MSRFRNSFFVIILASIAIHICLIGFWIVYGGVGNTWNKSTNQDILEVAIQNPPPKILNAESQNKASNKDAPLAPSAEDWAFASSYSLKNSKAYRYNWGQQVRSMMGTSVAAKDQGQVRFLVEIAPNGSIAKVETLWKTSDVAERLAYKAIKSMPSLPPTPNGKPLVFERTITFASNHSDEPPIYRDDCIPDTPAFKNPFAWDGKTQQVIATPKAIEKPDPKAMAECLKQLPQDSIEAQAAENKRQLNQWRSSKIAEEFK